MVLNCFETISSQTCSSNSLTETQQVVEVKVGVGVGAAVAVAVAVVAMTWQRYILSAISLFMIVKLTRQKIKNHFSVNRCLLELQIQPPLTTKFRYSSEQQRSRPSILLILYTNSSADLEVYTPPSVKSLSFQMLWKMVILHVLVDIGLVGFLSPPTLTTWELEQTEWQWELTFEPGEVDRWKRKVWDTWDGEDFVGGLLTPGNVDDARKHLRYLTSSHTVTGLVTPELVMAASCRITNEDTSLPDVALLS